MAGQTDYEIYIDVSIDIEMKYLEENGIRIIPMEYTVDDGRFVMDRPQTEEELKVFYDKMRAGSLTGTSQITPYTYEQTFRKAAEEGKNVLYLCLSGGLSSTYESSLTAAALVRDDYPDMQIECVDTLGATGGMGLLLLLAIRGREAGKSLTENAAFLRENALNVCYWFMVEDLVYLKRIAELKSLGFSLDEISRIIKLKAEDESGNKRRTELLAQYRSKLSADIERMNTLQTHINELRWHIDQLESAEDAFTSCPGSACASCEHKTRCIFFREN